MIEWFRRKYLRTISRIRLAGKKADNWYNSNIRKPANDWYNQEFYPEIGRHFDYWFSIDRKGIKENLKIRNIPKILKNPQDFREFVEYFVPKSLLSLQRKLERAKIRRDESPEKAAFYKRKAAELEKQVEQTKREVNGWANMYVELDSSVEAAKARLAAGKMEQQEKTIDCLNREKKTLEAGLLEIGAKYGEQLQIATALERDLKSKSQTNLEMHQQQQIQKSEAEHLEAIIENENRNHRKVLAERDRLIGFLRKRAQAKEQTVLEVYLKKVSEFLDRYGSSSIIWLSPGREGTVIYCSESAKNQLHFNGDAQGKPYYELLGLNSAEKNDVIDYFDSLGEKDVVLSVTPKKGKPREFEVAALPLVDGEGNHLMSIITVSSLGFLERRSKEIQDKRIARRIAERNKRREEIEKKKTERQKAHESALQEIDRIKKEMDELNKTLPDTPNSSVVSP